MYFEKGEKHDIREPAYRINVDTIYAWNGRNEKRLNYL